MQIIELIWEIYARIEKKKKKNKGGKFQKLSEVW